MKKIFFLALACVSIASRALAQDTATFEFRVGNDKAVKRVVIELDSAAAPESVANFEKLIHHKFYKGLSVHRVIAHAIVQMGDPLSRYSDRSRVGTGGPGYTLPPEIHLKHTAGAVAMSRLDDTLNPARRSNGSQFYICLVPMPNLDGQYTVFGHVREGMEVIEALSQQPADTNNNPIDAIRITNAWLGNAAPHPLFKVKLWPWG